MWCFSIRSGAELGLLEPNMSLDVTREWDGQTLPFKIGLMLHVSRVNTEDNNATPLDPIPVEE
jgi:hypothetical protein